MSAIEVETSVKLSEQFAPVSLASMLRNWAASCRATCECLQDGLSVLGERTRR